MKQNVGVLDSVLRVGLGFGLIFAGFLLAEPLNFVAYVAALAFIISGFAGKCLLYSLLGISTCGAAAEH